MRSLRAASTIVILYCRDYLMVSYLRLDIWTVNRILKTYVEFALYKLIYYYSIMVAMLWRHVVIKSDNHPGLIVYKQKTFGRSNLTLLPEAF